jgi:hypothetical protein
LQRAAKGRPSRDVNRKEKAMCEATVHLDRDGRQEKVIEDAASIESTEASIKERQ